MNGKTQIGCLLVVGILLMMVFIPTIPWNRIMDNAAVEWMEAEDANWYAEIKDGLASYIETKENVEVEKVVFQVNVKNYASHIYLVTVYYKEADGYWYEEYYDSYELPTVLNDMIWTDFIQN